MARTHGRIYTSIWADDDFRRLAKDAQRVYTLLLSQPQINNCGVLPFVPKKWARLARDENEQSLALALGELAHTRFIILDETTDELLVRTFIKHDRIEKQPQLANAAKREFTEIDSRTIRRSLVDEYPQLFAELGTPDLYERVPEPLFNPSHEGSPETSPEGSGEESEETSLARPTQAHTRAPAPSPTPAPSPSTTDVELRAARLPIEKQHAVHHLMTIIGDHADEGRNGHPATITQVTALAKRLPVAALHKVAETTAASTVHNRAGYAVAALQDEFAAKASVRAADEFAGEPVAVDESVTENNRVRQ